LGLTGLNDKKSIVELDDSTSPFSNTSGSRRGTSDKLRIKGISFSNYFDLFNDIRLLVFLRVGLKLL
jgi:hypothetical protein